MHFMLYYTPAQAIDIFGYTCYYKRAYEKAITVVSSKLTTQPVPHLL